MPTRGPAPTLGRLGRTVLAGLGWAIFALGVVVFPLPGPLGLPIMALGGLILLRFSPSARRLFVRAKRRAPGPFAATIRRFEGWRARRRLGRRA